MPGLKSLRNRLAVIFALIILGAIGTIYLSVTPRLEASLQRERLNALAVRSRQYTPTVAGLLERTQSTARDRKSAEREKQARDSAVRKFAEGIGTEVIVMSIEKAGPYLLTDSAPDGGAAVGDVQDVTRQARLTRRQAAPIAATRNGRQALAAQQVRGPGLDGTYVVVFSDSLADVADNVSLIRRQVLFSGAIALAIAVLAG